MKLKLIIDIVKEFSSVSTLCTTLFVYSADDTQRQALPRSSSRTNALTSLFAQGMFSTTYPCLLRNGSPQPPSRGQCMSRGLVTGIPDAKKGFDGDAVNDSNPAASDVPAPAAAAAKRPTAREYCCRAHCSTLLTASAA
mmetsp:Transcript_36446/g.60375  ORF Transcript_36446/g.60375 Transcript_36446/m.60375 type:complete len:139 (+) Transcript_36446:144-560(+)